MGNTDPDLILFLLAGDLSELALESFHTTRGVDESLLACEEGVAVRADLETQVLTLSGAGFPLCSTRTGYGHSRIFGMNFWLHFIVNLSHFQMIFRHKSFAGETIRGLS